MRLETFQTQDIFQKLENPSILNRLRLEVINVAYLLSMRVSMRDSAVIAVLSLSKPLPERGQVSNLSPTALVLVADTPFEPLW